MSLVHMSPLEVDPEIRALLEADGIIRVTASHSLSVEEVDRLLRTAGGSRCILTDSIHKNPRWLTPLERNDLWRQEIRPRMLDPSWEGSYDALEWRTDKDESIIVLVHSYVPI